MAVQTRQFSAGIELTASRMFAQVFRAYIECDSKIQQVIQDMAAIINDPDVDPEDREMAVSTLHEALFPACSHVDGHLGEDLEQREGRVEGAEKAEQERIDQEQETFSRRVSSILEDRGMTQSDLAEAIGVTQGAVSLLLSRGNRPQRRTIEKMAQALKVTAEELWPS